MKVQDVVVELFAVSGQLLPVHHLMHLKLSETKTYACVAYSAVPEQGPRDVTGYTTTLASGRLCPLPLPGQRACLYNTCRHYTASNITKQAW